jgi:hypothetical protein
MPSGQYRYWGWMKGMSEQSNEHPIDPVIVEFVTTVTNRFGVSGLEDMIALASKELETAKAALAQLAELDASSD